MSGTRGNTEWREGAAQMLNTKDTPLGMFFVFSRWRQVEQCQTRKTRHMGLFFVFGR